MYYLEIDIKHNITDILDKYFKSHQIYYKIKDFPGDCIRVAIYGGYSNIAFDELVDLLDIFENFTMLGIDPDTNIVTHTYIK